MRVTHCNKRCHLEVGAPAQQDEDSAVVRTASAHMRQVFPQVKVLALVPSDVESVLCSNFNASPITKS